MQLSKNYSLLLLELGYDIRHDYHEGIWEIRTSNSVENCLEIVDDLFSSLSKSHPAPERVIEWAEEIIQVYRNLGEIAHELREIKGDIPEDKNLRQRIESLESKFS